MARCLTVYVAPAIMLVACSGSTVGTRSSTKDAGNTGGTLSTGGATSAGGARSGGGVTTAMGGSAASGGSGASTSTGGSTSSGGAGGTTGLSCSSDADCPQRGCYMCAATKCVNGHCVIESNPGAGGSSTGGQGSGGVQSGGAEGVGGFAGMNAGGKAGSAGTGGGGNTCGTTTCGANEICITGRCAGCCNLPPACIPKPSNCLETYTCGCFATDPCGGCTKCQSVTGTTVVCGNCTCVCAAAWSPVATPNGSRRIADLQVGDLVYTIDHGERVAMPIARVNRRQVTRHALVRARLSGGTVVEMSGGHPTGDGGRFDGLMPGQRLGAAEIVSVETVPYDEPFTYDILPSSDTGTYFVGDAWVGSTLYDGHCNE